MIDRQITFFAEGVPMPSIDEGVLRRWIVLVAQSYGYSTGDINYIFCSDAYILDVNRRFLKHDYYTDIITFDETRGRKIAGDIYISLDTVHSNAQQLQVMERDELHRVVIHGVLHLCGINDKGPGERELMEKAENAALARLSSLCDGC